MLTITHDTTLCIGLQRHFCVSFFPALFLRGIWKMATPPPHLLLPILPKEPVQRLPDIWPQQSLLEGEWEDGWACGPG